MIKFITTLMLCFLTFSLNAQIDEEKLTDYVMRNIDRADREYKTGDNKYNKYYCKGQVDILKKLFYMIKTSFQKDENDLNAKVIQDGDGMMIIEYEGHLFFCYPNHVETCPCIEKPNINN